MASQVSSNNVSSGLTEEQCCGNCLLLYTKKDGRNVWLCKKINSMRVSDPDNNFCKQYTEKDKPLDLSF